MTDDCGLCRLLVLLVHAGDPPVEAGLHVMLMAPNYTPLRQPAFIDFKKKYINTHGWFPPEYMNYTKLGYDFMIIVGQALKKYGVYFQEGMIRDGLLPGRLSRGPAAHHRERH